MQAHILIVEDEPITRLTLGCHLQKAGFQVTAAASGEAALAALDTERFAVVITDLSLGDMDGRAVLTAAYRQSQRPAVIVLSGHSAFEMDPALKAAVFAYLEKPATGTTIITCVEQAVRHHQHEPRIR